MPVPRPAANPLWDAPGPDARCGGCAWRYVGGPGRPVERCRRHRGARVDPTWPACPAFEGPLDCLACGACCREAYHRVEVSRRDPFVRLHPERVGVDREDGRWVVLRDGPRCGCLAPAPPHTCAVYADRPRTCRDFAVGGVHCVEARRRVGLTR